MKNDDSQNKFKISLLPPADQKRNQKKFQESKTPLQVKTKSPELLPLIVKGESDIFKSLEVS